MSKKLTQEEFEEKVFNCVGNEFSVLGEYKNATTKVLMRHNNCCCSKGYYEWEVTPHTFFKGKLRCPCEAKQHSAISLDVIQERLDRYHTGYKCLSTEYIKSDLPLMIMCNKGHKYEASLDNITQGSGCPYCNNQKVLIGYNDLNTTNPEISKYLVNKNDGEKCTYGSNTILDFKCPNCGKIISKYPSLLLSKSGKFVCSCSDGISYPEKYFESFFKQLGVEYIYQLSKKHFEWCDKYRYDFYLPSTNTIIEVHGLQHYKNCNWADSLFVIQENDKIKKELAIKNGVNYIVVDARNSTSKYISNNIIKSQLSQMFDLSKVDFNLCNIYANNSKVKQVIDLWNSGINNAVEIGNKVGLVSNTVLRYLDNGAESGLCDFDREVYRKIVNHGAKRVRVKCIETNITYSSFNEVLNKLNIRLSQKTINTQKTVGGYHWEILSDAV